MPTTIFNSIGMEFVLIPDGTFWLAVMSESPQARSRSNGYIVTGNGQEVCRIDQPRNGFVERRDGVHHSP